MTIKTKFNLGQKIEVMEGYHSGLVGYIRELKVYFTNDFQDEEYEIAFWHKDNMGRADFFGDEPYQSRFYVWLDAHDFEAA